MRTTRSLAAACVLLPLVGATTRPATQPTWEPVAGGQRILRPFDSAPYPHPSRANGFTSKNGTFPADPHYTDSTVGIFVPASFMRGKGGPINFVVHFHGWGNHVEKVFAGQRLAEQTAGSGADAVLIVPQGPRDAKDSGCGKLELDPGGLARLVADVAAYLKAEGLTDSTEIGHVTLTAHSGGYKVTAAVLDKGGLTDHITDVVLLDASYGGLESFTRWATAGDGRRLVSFYTAHLKDENVLLRDMLVKAGLTPREVVEAAIGDDAGRGVILIPTTRPHDDVPQYFEATVRHARLRRE